MEPSTTQQNTTLNSITNADNAIYSIINEKKQYWAPGEIIRPIGSTEMRFAAGSMYQDMNTVQVIWMKSRSLVTVEDMKEALWFVSREVPPLQLCLARSGLNIWFQMMKKFSIDFEEVTDEALNVVEHMLETKYDLWNGPLWKVRMVKPKEVPSEGTTSGFFQFALILSVLHVITDATTNMKICRDVVSFLNRKNMGKSLGVLPITLSSTADELFTHCFKMSYLFKFAIKWIIDLWFNNWSSIVSFEGCLPAPTPEKRNAKSKFFFDDLSEKETTDLITMCRTAKITVHSCIVALANFALLQTAQSGSTLPLGSRTIYTWHAVNMRRYFPEDAADATGCHISFFRNQCKMSLSKADEFWDQARDIHQDLKNELEVKREHINIIPLHKFDFINTAFNSYLSQNGYSLQTDCHYHTSNMGNLKNILPGPKPNDNVEITYMLRTGSSTLTRNPFLIAFHTFRGRLLVSLDYFTNKMTEETAQYYFTTFLRLLRNLANSGSIGPISYDDDNDKNET